METKADLVYDHDQVLYSDDNRSYRKERLWSGFLAVLLGLAAMGAGLAYFRGQWFYQTLIALFTAFYVLIGAVQIIVSVKLADYPHGILITYEQIILRERKKYHYIDFDSLKTVRFQKWNCKPPILFAWKYRYKVFQRK